MPSVGLVGSAKLTVHNQPEPGVLSGDVQARARVPLHPASSKTRASLQRHALAR